MTYGFDESTKLSMIKYLEDYVEQIKGESTEKEIRYFIGGFMACACGAKIITEQERDRILMSYTGVKW